MDLLFGHYGIDWLATALTITGLHLLSNKHRSGFLVMIIANLAWGTLAIIISSLAMIVANIVIGIMNYRAYTKWATKTPKVEKTP